jgi:hypothetical protein
MLLGAFEHSMLFQLRQIWTSIFLELHLKNLLQDSSHVGTSNEAFIEQKLFDRLLSAKRTSSKSARVKKSEAGYISFLQDGRAKLVMPVLQTGPSRSRDLQDSNHCFQLLGDLNVQFLYSITAGTAEPHHTFMLSKDHVQSIPVLLNLLECRKEPSIDASKQLQSGDAASERRTLKRQRVSVTSIFTVPFDPPQPASAPGLACLLLLLEEEASPLQLFGASPCGPRLAMQCLSVRPFSY